MGCLIIALAILAGSAEAAWVSPTGHSDPGNKWSGETSAYDDNPSTYARNTPVSGWGSYIELNLASAVPSDRIRVMADFGYGYVDEVDIDIYDGSVWVDAFQGSVTHATYTEVGFASTTVERVRFRFHYLSTMYIFWLYELQVLDTTPPVVAPTVADQYASSADIDSVILHATVEDDGGDPLEYRFQYGFTDSYGSSTAWKGDRYTGDVLSEIVTGLVTDSTYHFRVQMRNTGGTTSGADMTFQTSNPATGWLAPTSTSDASGKWIDPDFSRDDNPTTPARIEHVLGEPQWSEFLELGHSAANMDRIRFSAKDDPNIDRVDIDVYRDGAWVDVFESAFSDQVTTEVRFTVGSVDKARVRFRVDTTAVGLFWELYGFQFHVVEQVTLSGNFDGVSTVRYANDGVEGGAYAGASPYSFTVWVGLGDSVAIYCDDSAANASLVTVSDASDRSDLHLFTDALTLYSSDAGVVDFGVLEDAHASDDDILYDISVSTLEMAQDTAIRIPSGLVFDFGAHDLSLDGDFINDGSFSHTGGIATFKGDTTVLGSSTSYFNGVNITGTLTAHGTLMGVKAGWADSGVFDGNGGTVEFAGTTTFGGANDNTFASVLITGTLTAHSTRKLNVTENWRNLGTFNNSGRTVTFNGGSAGTISGTSAFHHLVIAKTGLAQVLTTGEVSVGGTLSVTGGSFTAGAPLQLAGGITHTVSSGAGFGISGSEGSPVTVTRTGTGEFTLQVQGSLSLQHFTVLRGLIVLDGNATVQRMQTGGFDLVPTGGVYIDLTGFTGQPFFGSSVAFKNSGGDSSARNVSATATSSHAHFTDFSGSLSGEAWDDDPANRVHWMVSRLKIIRNGDLDNPFVDMTLQEVMDDPSVVTGDVLEPHDAVILGGDVDFGTKNVTITGAYIAGDVTAAGSGTYGVIESSIVVGAITSIKGLYFSTVLGNVSGVGIAINDIVMNDSASLGATTASSNLVGLYSELKPLFVSPDAGDFHLKGSAIAAIDKGEAVPGMGAKDLDGGGRPVNGAYDIGADEYSNWAGEPQIIDGFGHIAYIMIHGFNPEFIVGANSGGTGRVSFVTKTVTGWVETASANSAGRIVEMYWRMVPPRTIVLALVDTDLDDEGDIIEMYRYESGGVTLDDTFSSATGPLGAPAVFSDGPDFYMVFVDSGHPSGNGIMHRVEINLGTTFTFGADTTSTAATNLSRRSTVAFSFGLEYMFVGAGDDNAGSNNANLAKLAYDLTYPTISTYNAPEASTTPNRLYLRYDGLGTLFIAPRNATGPDRMHSISADTMQVVPGWEGGVEPLLPATTAADLLTEPIARYRRDFLYGVVSDVRGYHYLFKMSVLDGSQTDPDWPVRVRGKFVITAVNLGNTLLFATDTGCAYAVEGYDSFSGNDGTLSPDGRSGPVYCAFGDQITGISYAWATRTIAYSTASGKLLLFQI